jgi:hypothetical protein
MWTRGSGKRLRGNLAAQTLGSYLVSASGSNMIGLYHLAIATAAAEIGQTVEVVREAFAACARAGFAFFDEDAELVWIPNVASIEIGDGLTVGDKRRKAVEKDLRALGAHRFVDDFVAKYGKAFRLDWKPEGPSGGSNPPPDAPSGGDIPLPEGGSHQGLTGTQQVRDTAEALPAQPAHSLPVGFLGMERDWFAEAVRGATGNDAFVPPAPMKCGALLEVMRRIPECRQGSDAARAWLLDVVARYVADTDDERKFNPLTPEAWAAWVGEDQRNALPMPPRPAPRPLDPPPDPSLPTIRTMSETDRLAASRQLLEAAR